MAKQTWLTAILLFLPHFADADALRPQDFPWVKELRAAGIREIAVCGSSRIRPVKSSLRKDFFSGNPPRAYLFTGLPGRKEYFDVLSEKGAADAKRALSERFRGARLWRIDATGQLSDLGVPSGEEMGFSQTVKDCLETGSHPMGQHKCEGSFQARKSCCTEKFPGPRVFWGKERKFRLMFTPDPSVRLKVPGEALHRYCDIQSFMAIAPGT